MKFGEIVPKVLKTLRSPVGRMTSHPDVNLSGSAMPPIPQENRKARACQRNGNHVLQC